MNKDQTNKQLCSNLPNLTLYLPSPVLGRQRTTPSPSPSSSSLPLFEIKTGCAWDLLTPTYLLFFYLFSLSFTLSFFSLSLLPSLSFALLSFLFLSHPPFLVSSSHLSFLLHHLLSPPSPLSSSPSALLLLSILLLSLALFLASLSFLLSPFSSSLFHLRLLSLLFPLPLSPRPPISHSLSSYEVHYITIKLISGTGERDKRKKRKVRCRSENQAKKEERNVKTKKRRETNQKKKEIRNQ